MATLDDHIARQLADSLRSGELQSAPSWGKPLQPSDGFEATPDELRLPYKILKDAGVVPAEVLMMQKLAKLKRRLVEATEAGDAEASAALRLQLSELRQSLALRMERLRATGKL